MSKVFETREEAEAWKRSWDELKPNQLALLARVEMLCPCASDTQSYHCGAEGVCACADPELEVGAATCRWLGHEAIMDAVKGSRQYGYLCALDEASRRIALTGGILRRPGITAALGVIGDLFDEFVASEKLEPFDHDKYFQSVTEGGSRL